MKEIILASAQPTATAQVNTLACLEALLDILIKGGELSMLAIGSFIILTVVYKRNKIRSIAKSFRMTALPAKLSLKEKFAVCCGGGLVAAAAMLESTSLWLAESIPYTLLH
ncbi:MAG: hypothetical protein WC028_15365 [Candidatus Obscuribacterales bacterium]